MTASTRSIGVAVLALSLSCSASPLTELVVVVDTNLAVPSEIDRVEVVVTGGAASQTAAGGVTSAADLPRTVTLVHREGPLGPVVIRARGLLGATAIVVREARTFFVAGERRVLRLALDRACAGVPCAVETTCAAGTCRTVDVGESELLVYPNGVGHVGTDGSVCMPVTERCNRLDDDCDGTLDEGFDLSTDPLNCGACMMACPPRANATSTCAAGACGLTCNAGFDDCDADVATGCEADLTSPSACGSCDNACAIPNATSTCTAGACAFEACMTGFGDCDAAAANGCEIDLATTPEHCGGCGMACTAPNATPGCAGSACTIASCDAGFGDCDAAAANGCEITLTTLTDCGACGTACALPNATADCSGGSCAVMACNVGFADCDGMAVNGCERLTTTLTDCGMCGRTCALANGTETCATGTCEVAMCNTGFGDCDAAPANGCETNLSRTDMHCGMCGNACVGGNRCRMSVCR